MLSPEINTLGLEALRAALNDDNAEFRPGQLEAVEALVHRRARMLLIQRTGWGKSIVYFIATRFLRDRGAGPTLLISPLISLMRNQIAAAGGLHIHAASVNTETRDEWDSIRSCLQRDEIDILLVAPERLANDRFRDKYLLPVLKSIGMFVVDEAHCISDWGHDFRPDYRRIGRITRALPPSVPLLATTATANDRVVRDIVEQFGGDIEVSRGPLRRDSLILQNISLPDPASRLAWLSDNIGKLPGSGVIYTLTKHDAERTADWLKQRGINAPAYHSDVDPSGTGLREVLENKLLHNQVKALVATTALGMGFDKPDLGFVIHYQKPGSVVHYYQQVGRAGRAMRRAYGILFHGGEDDDILNYFVDTALPSAKHVDEVLSVLDNAPEGLIRWELQKRVNMSSGELERVLKTLSVETPQPIRRMESKWFRTPAEYRVDASRIERLKQLRLHERERMLEYMNSRECLMSFLVQELNDPDPSPCGRCAVCRGEPVVPMNFSAETLREAQRFLSRLEIPFEPRKLAPVGSLEGYGIQKATIPGELRCSAGRILCRWGDPGLGDLVRFGKYYYNRFDDKLIDAAATMIMERWNPDPFPEWGTSVPSRRHPRLVADLAERLCARLGIPYVSRIKKVRETAPQKEMQNSYHQAHNLDSAFMVKDLRKLQGRPVLLIDDMVDSGWTMTIAGLALRQAGAGVVYPFALARTSKGNRR